MVSTFPGDFAKLPVTVQIVNVDFTNQIENLDFFDINESA